MTALIGAVFVASLLGSVHCAGMCGAFVAFAVASGGSASRPPSKAALNAMYNLGRLGTYTILGGVCGGLGAAMNMGGAMGGIQQFAAIVAGSMMVLFGLIAVLRHIGVRIPRVPAPPPLRRWLAAGHRRAFDLPPLTRAVSIGLLTTLLPCGWLYAFAITAAGTASPLWGAVTMMAFWLGTLPVMMSLGVGLQALTGSLRRFVPVTTSLLIVVVGLYTVVGRLHIPNITMNSAVAQPTSLRQSIDRVQSLDSDEMPCCHAH